MTQQQISKPRLETFAGPPRELLPRALVKRVATGHLVDRQRRPEELTTIGYGGFPDGVRVEKSYVTLPEIIGIGFEGKSDLFSVMKQMVA